MRTDGFAHRLAVGLVPGKWRLRVRILASVWPSLSELSVEALGANRATLSWPTALDESGVARYSIFQDEVLIAAVPGDVTRAQIGPLSPNLAYAFSVRAEDEYGNSSILGPGGTLTLPDTAEPIFPAERVLDIVQTGHAEVTLRWTPATDDVSVVSYRVFKTSSDRRRRSRDRFCRIESGRSH